MKLEVHIGNVKFANPVTVASGTFAHGEKYYALEEVRKLGALIPKTITLHPRSGNPPPRVIETPSGMLNAIGIENVGADVFLNEKLPLLRKIGIPLIISLSANTDEELTALIEKCNSHCGIAALELNLSCPNLQHNILVAQDPVATERVVRKAKSISRLPVIAKLSPNVTDITEIAIAAETAGADALSLINTLSGMAIDIRSRRPVLGNVTGGLSGPAIKPVALRMVYQVARKVQIPIIGMGGIMSASDAIEFLIAGAALVAVGTYNFIDPRAPLNVLQGLKEYMRKNKMRDIRELIGSVQGDT